MTIRLVRDWWWPLYVFAYPLLAWPGRPNLEAAFSIRAYVTVAFILVGIALELSAPEWRSASLIRSAARGIARHRPVSLALVFIAWVLVAALFSPNRAIALTGSLVAYGDGAMWMVGMVCVFALTYVRALHSPHVASRIAAAVVASGVVLTAGALTELVIHHGLVYQVAGRNLPVVTFPQKGHLAGMIALAGGVALGLAPKVLVPILGFGIGLCLNRSAGLALTATCLVPIPRSRRALVTALSVLLIAVAAMVGGGIVSKAMTGSAKQVASAHTLESRTFYYRAAARGIAARPLLGWGGGNFEFAWPAFLSPAELSRFGRAEWGFEDVVSAQLSDAGPPVLAVHDASGRLQLVTIDTFKAHDQLLEAALMWGIPGLVFYAALFAFGLLGVRRGEPLSLGILAYALFALLWFVIPETQGLLWAMLGAAAGLGRGARGRSAARAAL